MSILNNSFLKISKIIKCIFLFFFDLWLNFLSLHTHHQSSRTVKNIKLIIHTVLRFFFCYNFYLLLLFFYANMCKHFSEGVLIIGLLFFSYLWSFYLSCHLCRLRIEIAKVSESIILSLDNFWFRICLEISKFSLLKCTKHIFLFFWLFKFIGIFKITKCCIIICLFKISKIAKFIFFCFLWLSLLSFINWKSFCWLLWTYPQYFRKWIILKILLFLFLIFICHNTAPKVSKSIFLFFRLLKFYSLFELSKVFIIVSIFKISKITESIIFSSSLLELWRLI